MSGEDLASLGIKVDASQVGPAAAGLDGLTAAGSRAEKQMGATKVSAADFAAALKAAGGDLSKISASLDGTTVSAKSTAAAFEVVAATGKASFATLAQGINASVGLTDVAFKKASASAAVFGESLAGLSALQASTAEVVAASAATMAGAMKGLGSAAVQSAAVQVEANAAVAVSNEVVAASSKVNARAITESFVIIREAARGNFTRMAGSVSILTQALGGLYTVLIPVGIAAAVAGAGLLLATNQINEGANGTGDLTRGLGLTADQLDRVKDKYVTFGDTFKAVFQVLYEDIGGPKIGNAVQEVWNGIASFISGTMLGIIQIVAGAVAVIAEEWRRMPTFLGGEGIGFGDGVDAAKAFDASIDATKKKVDQFYADVAAQARKNAVANILDQAGKAGGSGSSSNPLNSIDNKIDKLREEAVAQQGLNDAVAAGDLTTAQAATASKFYQQVAGDIVKIQNDERLSIVEKTNAIFALISAQGQLNISMAQWDFLQRSQQDQDALGILALRINLIGQSNEVTARAVAEQNAWNFAIAHGYSAEDARTYVNEQVLIASGQVILAEHQKAYNDELSLTANLYDQLDSQAQKLSTSLSNAFGEAGKALGDLLTTQTGYAKEIAKLDEEQKKHDKDNKGDTAEQIILTQKRKNADVDYYSSIIDASSEFFEKGSAGYKALQAVEVAYRLYEQLASIQAIAQKATEATQTVASDAVQTSANVATGASSMFAQLGPFAFPVVAAMLGVMAALGFGGGGSGPSASDIASNDPANSKKVQASQGAGTVLGDAAAKSDSIQKSLDALNKNTNSDLEYSNQMVVSLRSIDAHIGNLTGLLANQLKVGGLFDSSTLGLGTSGGGGGLLSGLFGSTTTTKTLLDQGIQIAGTTIGAAIANGIAASAYQTTQTTEQDSGFFFGLFGGGTSTSNSTKNTQLGSDFTSQITSIISGLRSTVLDAATRLGVEGAEQVVDSLSLNIGKISLNGLSGSEIQDALNSVFSALGDQIVSAAIPQVTALQKVGEGALETLSRLVNEYSVVDDAAKTVGFSFSAVGVDSLAARDKLVQLSGGLDQFTSQANAFASEFLTTAQQIAPIAKSVASALTALGVGTVTTKAQFVQLVQGIDTSTDAGAELYAALQNIAPAFGKVADAAQDIADKQTDLQIKLLEDQGDALGALNLQRQKELASLDDSLKPLQNAIYAQEDLNAARQAAQDATDAYNKAIKDLQAANDNLASANNALTKSSDNLASSLKSTITQFSGFSNSLSTFLASLNAGSASNGGILSQYKNAKSAFLGTASAAQGGDATALSQLQNAATTFLNASKTASATSAQYNSDLAIVKDAVTKSVQVSQTIANSAGSQYSALVQAPLEAAVIAAQAAVASALSNVPGHASGLNNVPYDGYLMRAHQGEAILTKSQANNWRGGNDNSGLGATLDAMRRDLSISQRETAHNTKQLYRLMRRMTRDGQTLAVNTNPDA